MEVADKIRTLCARLAEVPVDSPEAARYGSELKAVAAQLAVQEKQWNKSSQGDKHRDKARQVYRSRETDSADAFAEGLKLFNAKKQDSKENKKD